MRQLSAGRLDARLAFLQLDGLLVNRERWSHRVFATGTTPPGHLALAGPDGADVHVLPCDPTISRNIRARVEAVHGTSADRKTCWTTRGWWTRTGWTACIGSCGALTRRGDRHRLAHRWGFKELGRMAGDYRQLFGELPSPRPSIVTGSCRATAWPTRWPKLRRRLLNPSPRACRPV